MKYDKMIAVNKAESEQKIKKAIRAIDDMGARGLPISVTELVRWTGLSRGFFIRMSKSVRNWRKLLNSHGG